jgi:outer membrane protein assembly factor BamB
VVVTFARPTYCGVALAAAVWAIVAHPAATSAQTRRRPEPLPKVATLLLPAEVAWTSTLPDSPAAPGLLVGNTVVVPLVSGEIHAIDRDSGETRWTQDALTHTAPIAAGPHVVIATETHVEARSVDAGTVAWTQPLDMPVRGLAGTADLVVVLGPRAVLALDAWTGAQKWRLSLDEDALSLAVGPRGVAIVTAGARVVLFGADSRRLWVRELPGALGPPAWAEDIVIVGATDSRMLWALDAGNGKISWKWQLGGTPAGIGAGIEDAYVTALDNVLRALRRGNGHQRWHADLGTRPLYPPVAVDGAVFVTGYSPSLTLFDAKTGKPIDTYDAPARVLGPPLVPLPIRPGAVSTLLLLYDRLLGLRSTGLSFPELPLVPFTALPGRSLGRERLPLAPQ